ncbi:hypothetical protein F5Y15DRAFT_407562 [Xylariaceae sp. FL0016]|nr:hypothetical protein F5Y15DRAFT_407562 [Xylariaceae sp. FL0016]
MHGDYEEKKASMAWWPWGKTAEQKLHENTLKQFSGKRTFIGKSHTKPTRTTDLELGHVIHDKPEIYGGAVRIDEDGKFIYRNVFNQDEVKYSDVAVYLSPTNYRPKRLVVQCSDHIYQDQNAMGVDWRRKKINGSVPKVLMLSEWALRPFQRTGVWAKIHGSIRLMSIAMPLQVLLAFPGTSSWENEDYEDMYPDFPAYHWHWAKHAINPLDQRPVSTTKAGLTKLPETASSRKRSVRPRKLYRRQQDGNWAVIDNPPLDLPYVFISHAKKSFHIGGKNGDALIRRMAKAATIKAGYEACWIDMDCIDQTNSEEKSLDIYRMCDVIRSSKRVVVMLPDDRVETRKIWGTRMWTLPEALLAPGIEIDFFTLDGGMRTLHLIEMSAEIWDDAANSEDAGGATRLLAEHYGGELVLSRLELFTTAVEAFFSRSLLDYHGMTPSDVALAMMGLLHYRIDHDDTDTVFQSLARLSLSNDSDRILERMVSLYPYPPDNTLPSTDDKGNSSFNPFYTLTQPDQYSTHLWDIQPSCYAVGIAHEDNTVLLDSCRVMHIRWKGFPKIVVARDLGLGRMLAMLFVTAGTWWFLQGFMIAIYYAPLFGINIGTSSQSNANNSATGTSDPTKSGEAAALDTTAAMALLVGLFFVIAALLSIFGPVSVRRLYGGQVLQSSSKLVGFEGTMALNKLERVVFGNSQGRLRYEPSSTPIMARSRDGIIRIGTEPAWVTEGRAPTPQEFPLPAGHRVFTLVDTGSLTVSIFSAERPPTVALLCGHEGGMLRAVLCSWQFENDCLYKEAVIRMSSSVWDAANLKGWLKVCLTSLNRQRRIEREKRAVEIRRDQDELLRSQQPRKY